MALLIDRNLGNNKDLLLAYYRSRSREIISSLSTQFSSDDKKRKAAAYNKKIVETRENLISTILNKAKLENWSNAEILDCILMANYTNYVVMLEGRNSIWTYDFMSFSRRIGELWEPFCKLCFYHPINELTLYIPPVFEDVRKNLMDEIHTFILNLNISDEEKAQLVKYYDKVWDLVSSGEIQLECDLHFIQNGVKYVVDFKSGFGSNEKGNTNRLLLVGSIYKNLEDNYQCLIFVRAEENNHYLQTLQHSGLWETTCADETYEKILQYTGYDLKSWINTHISWMEDFNLEMRQVIENNDLQTYLIW